MEWYFRAKKIFSTIDFELLLYANLTKLIGSLYLFTKKYFQEVLTVKSLKHCMFKLKLQIGLFDQNLVKKGDFDFKSDFI